MPLNPYINFGGNCARAFAFYEHSLGARVTAMMHFRDGPNADQFGADMLNRVMHAELALAGSVLMGTDGDGCDAPGTSIDGMHVVLSVDVPAEAERLYAALVEGGTAEMPIQETFWAWRFGVLVDRFGVPWMINCAKEAH